MNNSWLIHGNSCFIFNINFHEFITNYHKLFFLILKFIYLFFSVFTYFYLFFLRPSKAYKLPKIEKTIFSANIGVSLETSKLFTTFYISPHSQGSR